ncbi:MAG: hypothetical protein CK604_03870 [Curvibacter sp. PD_MW3]|nr:MAG: hypothetical protein CK604_03870 [Curvibacter sp. PD_MW3]
MTDGFLGRWSRRKQDVREGRPLEEKRQVVTEPVAPAAAVPADAAVPAGTLPQATPAVEAALPPPTLDDVQALHPQSDFKRFVATDVDPQVRNAAMKKLFADPHFNVMDGLDIYIDDYSKPDPLPLSMLRKMASAQFLNLVEPEEKTSPPPAPSGPAVAAEAESTPHLTDQPAGQGDTSQVPLSAAGQTTGSQPTTKDHADTDLRLQ